MVITLGDYLKTMEVWDPQSFWETGHGLPGRKLPKRPKTAVTAPPGFDHGLTSTNVVQASTPNPVSSTAGSNPLVTVEPSGLSAATQVQGS